MFPLNVDVDAASKMYDFRFFVSICSRYLFTNMKKFKPNTFFNFDKKSFKYYTKYISHEIIAFRAAISLIIL